MVRYSLDPENGSKCKIKNYIFLIIYNILYINIAAKARGSHLRCHFKNTRETAHNIKGMHLRRSVAYLKNVVNHKECVPFRRYNGSTGRCSQVIYIL